MSIFIDVFPSYIVEELNEQHSCGPYLQEGPESRCWSCLFQKSEAKDHEWIGDGDQSSVLECTEDHAYVNDILHL